MLKPVQGSRFGLAEMLFDLGPSWLNRIEVGRVGRQVEQRCPGRFDPLPHAVHFMGREIVGDHDLSRFVNAGEKIDQGSAVLAAFPGLFSLRRCTVEGLGHRRLAVTTYDSKCNSCIWGCAMAVEMIIDQWNPDRRRYRTETFCYGPLSCSSYKPGPTRKVPGRHGMTYKEEDWVDQDATAHRGPNE